MHMLSPSCYHSGTQPRPGSVEALNKLLQRLLVSFGTGLNPDYASHWTRQNGKTVQMHPGELSQAQGQASVQTLHQAWAALIHLGHVALEQGVRGQVAALQAHADRARVELAAGAIHMRPLPSSCPPPSGSACGATVADAQAFTI